MITAEQLISKAEYQDIIESVKNRAEFDFEKEFKKFNFGIRSSRFQRDGLGFKKGDYFVSVNYQRLHSDFYGRGYPLMPEEFQEAFKSYESARGYIVGIVSRVCDEDIELEAEEQLSLF